MCGEGGGGGGSSAVVLRTGRGGLEHCRKVVDRSGSHSRLLKSTDRSNRQHRELTDRPYMDVSSAGDALLT